MIYTNVICGMGVPYGTPSSAFNAQSVYISTSYYDFGIVDMTGGYGGTAVCTKGTTSLPVFNDYNYGQASVARRIYWYPESVLFDNTLLWSIYEMYTANGDCIPKYIYGVKI